jgi:LysR family nitrogen assimilation transcriptional regulator
MDLRQLRYFVAIAEAGSFTGGSQAVHVAQSALSKHIQALEDELGGALFDRGPRGVAVSEPGKVLLRHARFILGQIDRARVDVQSHNQELTGSVNFAAPSALSHLLFAPLVQRFLSRHPRVTLKLSEGLTSALIDRLQQGSLDLAVTAELPEHELVLATPLFTESMMLVGKAGDPLLRRRRIAIRQLVDLPLIFSNAPPWMAQVRKVLGDPQATLSARVHVDSVEPLKRIIAGGWGYGILPSSALSEHDAARELASVPIDGLGIARTLLMAKGRPISRAVLQMKTAIEEELAELIRQGRIATVRRQRAPGRGGPGC